MIAILCLLIAYACFSTGEIGYGIIFSAPLITGLIVFRALWNDDKKQQRRIRRNLR